MIYEFGLHGDLLMQMARQVLHDMDEFHRNNVDYGQISINIPEVTLATLSGRSELMSLINTYPHLNGHLTFEITEDVFIGRSGDMIQRSIKYFRDQGIRVSLDDFGTGFASFQHLRELEFDELKLDTGFVQDLGVDPAADVLVNGFLSIARGLGVQVVAEGVETQAQLTLLKSMGGEIVQGHIFGAAVTAKEAVALLEVGKVNIDHLAENAA
jgi:EAL domain-containing protein (putative c-di-GMP-specific phosphodiesterase class I)